MKYKVNLAYFIQHKLDCLVIYEAFSSWFLYDEFETYVQVQSNACTAVR